MRVLLSTLVLGVVGVFSQAILKEKVDEFFNSLNTYSANPNEQTCQEVLQHLSEDEDTQVTISGTTYNPDELQYLFCDYLPKVMNVDDMVVEVTNVEEARGNVAGSMMLDGSWLNTNNKFEDVELFWRVTVIKNMIKVFDLIPVNPSDFTEATMTKSMCGATHIWQAIGNGRDATEYLDDDVELSAPNLYAMKDYQEERQTTWSKDEHQNFIEATFGLFNFTGTTLKEYQVIDSDDENLLAVMTFHNLTTAKGKTSAEDIQFWVHFEFNNTETEETEEMEDQNTSQNQNQNQTSPCEDTPLLTGFRLLLSRPLRLIDVVDLGETLSMSEDEEDKEESQSQKDNKSTPSTRAGLMEDPDQEDGDDDQYEEDDKDNQTAPVDRVLPPQGRKEDEKENTTDEEDEKENTTDGEDDEENTTDGEDDEGEEEYTVKAEENYFSKPNLNIRVGESVTFVGLGDEHRVLEVPSLDSTPEDQVEDGFDSKGEEELTVTFDEPGEYFYLDEAAYDKGMRGKIVVG